ncbi:MAG: 50S ribosomal protein L21 [Xanthomarina sp.]|mgnify:FL=1|uniref:50S ribosomal protein L21 n=1 Tax=Flavobacteriaceae TaxID=49546 RepID=UPI000C471C6D|nr:MULTISPECIES: 50S ribosomal protein L21 [Flavobacteriaceae]MAL22238.1 50S ribosomal protein L21 [Xanthomarina sp.]MBF60776.1 50S ribosomal protein L21 [Xanthomarina sp.]HAB28857.1 50S ribosomal protein L21 [Xanthomarina gelatinilytica]|tara:strand:+ start:884 stop:1570 length:687 start_codon:yes stop_codon:yes gene_type:complete
MYAIVEIAGQQFKVEKDQKVFVHRLATEEGKQVSFDNVLLLADGDKVTVGAPAINGAQVGAKVLKHLKGDKVIVFKKKRRKGYRVKNGHRQSLTEIVIESIVASGAKPAAKAEKKAEPAKKAESKAAAPKTEAKKASPKKSAAKADDLKKIEGAGPKAAEALINAGYETFAKIAKATPEELSAVLTEASSRLAHLVTDTWPKQAKLAADGKWDELKALQEKLDGGIEK